MPKWIESLRGQNVIVSGDFRPLMDMNRTELHSVLRRLGANIHSDVKWSTDLLIRADSPMWLYGKFGEREAELAENQQRGQDVGVIDASDLATLIEGRGVWARDPMSGPQPTPPVGQPYVVALPGGDNTAALFARDPAAVERALAGHATTQNALADFLRNNGIIPLSPAGSAAQFDLAWCAGDTIWVAEIKSITAQNESVQMRLGLGQVIEYAWRLRQRHACEVRAVLVPEGPPGDPSWIEIAQQPGVLVSWPSAFSSLAAALGLIDSKTSEGL